jgi:hypothetical protein
MAKSPTKKTPPKKVTPTGKSKVTKSVKAAPAPVTPSVNDEERRWAFNPTRALTPVEITDLFRLLNLTVKGKKAFDKLDPDVAPLFVEVSYE